MGSLHLLLIHQPYLEYFELHIANAKTNYNYTIIPFLPLMNLREFRFSSDDLVIKFEDIVELLSYFPHLKIFSLDLITACHAFFDGEILRTLVHSLESFQFSIARFTPPTTEEQTLSTFYTPFWLETKQWYTQAYWNVDSDDDTLDYYHIYSAPYLFEHFNIRNCTNENLLPQEQFSSYPNVKLIDLSDTSDANAIPFLRRCPNLKTIFLNNIYDDELNYGTDEEDTDDEDQHDHSKCIQGSILLEEVETYPYSNSDRITNYFIFLF